MNYKAVSRKRERDKCVVRHTYVLKANLLSDSCRSEAHLSNVTSPRQEKTPAIDSAEPPERRIWHNSTTKTRVSHQYHARIQNVNCSGCLGNAMGLKGLFQTTNWKKTRNMLKTRHDLVTKEFGKRYTKVARVDLRNSCPWNT